MKANPTDCALFIDEQMAQLVIAWRRSDRAVGNVVAIDAISAKYSPDALADILGISKGQVSGLVCRAVALGVIIEGGDISDVAQKIVNAMIAKRLKEFRN